MASIELTLKWSSLLKVLWHHSHWALPLSVCNQECRFSSSYLHTRKYYLIPR